MKGQQWHALTERHLWGVKFLPSWSEQDVNTDFAGPAFHSDLWKLAGNLISLCKVPLCLLFVVFSAILMTLSPRGWSPREQIDAGSLSDSIMSPAKSPGSNQCPQLLHAELHWKEQHKATTGILKYLWGKTSRDQPQTKCYDQATFSFLYSGKCWKLTTLLPLTLWICHKAIYLICIFIISIIPTLIAAC